MSIQRYLDADESLTCGDVPGCGTDAAGDLRTVGS
jgi:hypothetical protein